MKSGAKSVVLIVALLILGALAGGAGIRFLFVRYETQYGFPRELANIVLQDPLFWHPSVEAGALENAVRELKRADEAAGALLRRKGVLDEQELYLPLSFLETLPAVGRAAEAFLEKPSGRTAAALLERYDSALEAYGNELAKYEEAMRRHSISDDEIIPNLALYRKNAAELRKAIDARKACVFRGECGIELNTIPLPTPTPSFVPRIPKALALPDENLAEKGMVRIYSTCWGNAKPWREMYLVEHRRQLLKLADENFYLVVPEANTLQDLLESGMITPKIAAIYSAHNVAGLPLYFVQDGIFRRCSDLAHYPQAYTLLWLKEALVSSPAIPDKITEKNDSAANAVLAEARALAEALKTAEAPSWNDAVRFANSLGAILDLRGQGRLQIDDSAAERIATLRSAITSGLPGFDNVLAALADDITTVMLWLWERNVVPPTAARISQTAFHSLTLLSFSGAVWRIDEQPKYLRQLPSENPRWKNLLSISDLQKLLPLTPGVPSADLLPLSKMRHLFNMEEITRITRGSREISTRFE